MNNLIHSYTGYMVNNGSNNFNFIIQVLKMFETDRESQLKILEMVRLNYGMQFYGIFKTYVFHKFRENDNIRILIKESE